MLAIGGSRWSWNMGIHLTFLSTFLDLKFFNIVKLGKIKIKKSFNLARKKVQVNFAVCFKKLSQYLKIEEFHLKFLLPVSFKELSNLVALSPYSQQGSNWCCWVASFYFKGSPHSKDTCLGSYAPWHWPGKPWCWGICTPRCTWGRKGFWTKALRNLHSRLGCQHSQSNQEAPNSMIMALIPDRWFMEDGGWASSFRLGTLSGPSPHQMRGFHESRDHRLLPLCYFQRNKGM